MTTTCNCHGVSLLECPNVNGSRLRTDLAIDAAAPAGGKTEMSEHEFQPREEVWVRGTVERMYEKQVIVHIRNAPQFYAWPSDLARVPGEAAAPTPVGVGALRKGDEILVRDRIRGFVDSEPIVQLESSGFWIDSSRIVATQRAEKKSCLPQVTVSSGAPPNASPPSWHEVAAPTVTETMTNVLSPSYQATLLRWPDDLRYGDEVWVRGKFLGFNEEKIVVQLYPHDQNLFPMEQVKPALLISDAAESDGVKQVRRQVADITERHEPVSAVVINLDVLRELLALVKR